MSSLLPDFYSTDGDDFLSWLMALVLLLTLVSCQKPVSARAKRILIPLEVIAVLAALKTQQAPVRKAPPNTCPDIKQKNGHSIRMAMFTLPLDNGELPLIT